MKKKIIALAGILLGAFLLVQSIIFAVDTINAYIVNYPVSYYTEINDRLEYPLLSYNDNTYMAVRDVGKITNKDVIWDEESESIDFVRKDRSESIVKEEDTALAIGKAIATEYYPDNVNNNTEYFATFAEVDSSKHDNLWCIYVKFNDENVTHTVEEMIMQYNVRIDINPMTCNFRIDEQNAEGDIVEILEFRN